MTNPWSSTLGAVLSPPSVTLPAAEEHKKGISRISDSCKKCTEKFTHLSCWQKTFNDEDGKGELFPTTKATDPNNPSSGLKGNQPTALSGGIHSARAQAHLCPGVCVEAASTTWPLASLAARLWRNRKWEANAVDPVNRPNAPQPLPSGAHHGGVVCAVEHVHAHEPQCRVAREAARWGCSVAGHVEHPECVARSVQLLTGVTRHIRKAEVPVNISSTLNDRFAKISFPWQVGSLFATDLRLSSLVFADRFWHCRFRAQKLLTCNGWGPASLWSSWGGRRWCRRMAAWPRTGRQTWRSRGGAGGWNTSTWTGHRPSSAASGNRQIPPCRPLKASGEIAQTFHCSSANRGAAARRNRRRSRTGSPPAPHRTRPGTARRSMLGEEQQPAETAAPDVKAPWEQTELREDDTAHYLSPFFHTETRQQRRRKGFVNQSKHMKSCAEFENWRQPFSFTGTEYFSELLLWAHFTSYLGEDSRNFSSSLNSVSLEKLPLCRIICLVRGLTKLNERYGLFDWFIIFSPAALLREAPLTHNQRCNCKDNSS